jgi:AcrR family transcriptional regulator
MSNIINKYHHGDLKSALLNAAKRLIVENGIDALSLRSIATEVGVSHMAPYAHFKNKSELFKSVAADGFLNLSNTLQSIQINSNQPKDLVLLYGVAYIEFATSNPQLYKLMLSQTNPSQSNPVQSIEKKLISSNDKVLYEASRKTYLLLRDCFKLNESNERKINIQAQGAWAFVHGIASLLITGQIVIDKESSITEFLTTATQAIYH